ncbi:MAG: hypothetical protein RI906_891 [Pseudomonadota bacterium]|jgi:G3E family GTPase
MRAIPVVVIGGYLGAGKTTLVNGLLRRAQGRRIAVLVNDFGDIDIDADLIEARDGDLLSLAGGCVCCSFGSDLMRALERMRSLATPPDCILIETSGVGLPGAVAASASLLTGLHLAQIAVMVDARAIRAQAADRYVGDTVLEQLRQAQSLMVSKSEGLTTSDFEVLVRWLSQMASDTPVRRVMQGNLPLDALLSAHSINNHRSSPPAQAGLKKRALRQRNHAGTRFASVALACAGRVDIERLRRALADAELGLMRLKAILRDPHEVWHSVQLAGGFWTLQACRAPRHQPGLVAIGAARRLDTGAISRILADCCLDQPEVSA